LGLAEDERAPSNAPKAVIIPFGLERSVTYGGGTANGPQAIITASHEVELFDEDLWLQPSERIRIDTWREPEIAPSVESALDQLAELTALALEAGAFPLTLGGEHSITPGAIRPLVERHPNLALLHFDAHADLRDGYRGERFSHASAIRRCLDWPEVSVVSIGIRNSSASEVPYLEAESGRISVFWAKDKADWSVEQILAPLEGRPVYVTFDVDGLDASLMPATGTPEPGGLFWGDVMPILKAAGRRLAIVGADVNELAPRPGLHGCDFIAAKLAYKILAYALAQR